MRTILLTFCLAFTGCAARQARPNYEIPVSSVSRVVCIHGDPQSKPLRCEKIAVTYRQGSEQMILPRK